MNIYNNMNNTIYSFIITLIAGLSTLIGIFPCLLKEKYKDNIIITSLAFSSGVMLTISLISLIPESYTLLREINQIPNTIIKLSFYIILGIIISTTINHKIENKNTLYKLGIISIITIILHNIPEGIATYISSSQNTALGLKLAFAITIHNIPEGISIAIPIYYSTKSLKKATIYTLISGLSEFIGALITYIFLKNYISSTLLTITLGITSGIMINISLKELLPNSLKYNKKKTTILFFILGIIIMFISEKILFK